MYVQRVKEVEPNIRYCAYNIGESTDIAQLMKLRPDAPGFDMLASKIDVRCFIACYSMFTLTCVATSNMYMCAVPLISEN